MDQVATRTDAERSMMAGTGRDAEVLTPDPTIVDPAEHNVVFTSLVTSDKDIVGLVAYSLYKQNKYDWLQAYGRLQGRMPDAAEAQSYLLGESTPRRLATYRHLAEAVLDGRGPDMAGAAPGSMRSTGGILRPGTPPSPAPMPTRARPRPALQLSPRAIAGLCIALGVLLILFWLLRSGAPLPPPTPGK